MGINTVVVIRNDFLHEFKEDGPLGKRLYEAVATWPAYDRDRSDFSAGQVISSAPADYHQVVIVHGNTGQELHGAKDLPFSVLDTMAECLKRHGWKASRPAKPKKEKLP